MSDAGRIYVVFASRNGAATLPRLLDGFANLEPPRAEVRIVALDNGSSDGTPALLRALGTTFPVEVLTEPEPGKNRALNRAIDHLVPHLSPDDLLVFTDDDVVPDPRWLIALEQAAAAHPGYAMFGGRIQPLWPVDPPRWMTAWNVPLDVAYAATTAAEGPVGADVVWGPNMLVRAEVVLAGHRYSENTGPDGSAVYGMGSETEFTVRLERAGYRAYFAEGAIVGHQVRREQMDESWLYQRGFRHGAGVARYRPMFDRPAPEWLGLPRGLAIRLHAYKALAALVRPLPPCRSRFQILWQERWLTGLATSYLSQRSAAADPSRRSA